VLLKLFMGDVAVGFYSVAYKITFAFQFIPLALVAALYPAFSHFAKSDKDQLRRIFNKGFNYLGFIALPLSLGIIALAPEIIIKVYTTEFSSAILPLQLLVASMVFLFMNFALSSMLNATDRQAINTRNLGLAMVLNVILNIILIPKIGIVGAALASSISTLLLFSINLAYVWPVIKIKLKDLQPLFMSLVISVIMMMSVIYLKEIIYWPLTIIIAIIIYIVLMMISKTFRWEELKFLGKSWFSK